ncbi:MAG: integrase arm-type DNA-binding domain-containing protein [Pseudomonadota bacterium]
MKLTERWLRAAKVKPPKERAEFHDDLVKGLAIRIAKSGRKTWFLRVQSGGKKARRRLGAYPDVPLSEARRRARQLLDDREQAQIGMPLPAADEAPGITIAELAERYYQEHAVRKKKPKGQRLDRSNLDLHVLPHWGELQAREITPRTVRQRLRDIAASAPVQSNRVRSLLSVMFRFGIDHELVDVNPVSATRPLNREQPRDRLLIDDEWRLIYRAFAERRSSNGDYLCFIMLTGQRPGQLVDAQFKDIQGDWLHIDAARTKIGRRHAVFLAPLAKAIVERRRTLGISRKWIFPGKDPREPLATYRNLVRNTRPKLDIPEWRPHDFRRYAFTTMRQLGVSAEDAEAVAQHTGNRIRRTYDHGIPFPQIERALTRFDAHAQRLLTAP